MARYLLLTFDNDGDADAFAQSLKDGTVFHEWKNPEGDGGHYGYLDSEHVTLRAVWQKPTKFCECKNPGERQPLSAKYQWRVHVECKKPIAGQMQHPRNLLEPLDQVPRHTERSIYLGVVEGQKKKLP
jgi:hypothetical protein